MIVIRISKFERMIVAGLIVRLALAPFLAHPFDIFVWYETGKAVLNGTQSVWSFLVPYYYSFFLFVFPGIIAFHVISPFFGSHSTLISSLPPQLNPGAFWNVTLVPGPLFDLLVKLPLIASDTAVALLLCRIVSRHLGNERMALSVSTAWFLNPLVIWVSSGWGTFDTLPTLFTVLSLYFVLDKKFAYSGLSLVAAVAMKYYAVVFVIPLCIIAWREGGRKGMLTSLASVAISGVVLFFPLLDKVASGLSTTIAGTSYLVPVYSGLTIWTAITLFLPFPSLPYVSTILVAASLLGLYYWMANRRSMGVFTCASYFGLSLIPLLLFFRFVAENYFVWFVPFAAVFALQNLRGRILFWTISIVALLSSVTNSLLPYYMLPTAPWLGQYLIRALSFFSSYRVGSGGLVMTAFSVGKLYLAGLGILSALILAFLMISWILAANKVRVDESKLRNGFATFPSDP